MQRHPIHSRRSSTLASFVARTGSRSCAAILLVLASACSNAAPTTNQSTAPTESVHTNTAQPKRVVGYLPNYRGPLSEWTQTLDFSALTHVNLAFASFDAGPDGVEIHYRSHDAKSGDEPDLATFVSAAHASNVKVCLSVGGWDNREELATAILNDPNGLAEKLARYAQDHGLDCIDADLEKESPSAQLIAAHETFIHDLASRLHDTQKQLTSAVGKWIPDTTLPVIDQFDFLNVMAYDYQEPRKSTVPVQASSISEAQAELEWWVSHGAAADKLVLGMPFYGFQWNVPTNDEKPKGLAVPYRQIVADLHSVPTKDELTINGATITLNSSETIRSKVLLGKTSYGGVMAWELWQDAQDQNSLLQVIKGAMR